MLLVFVEVWTINSTCSTSGLERRAYKRLTRDLRRELALQVIPWRSGLDGDVL